MPLNNLNRPIDEVPFNPAYAGPPAHVEGLVFWDDTDHTISLMPDVSGSVLQVGQENWVRVKNNSGVLIENGDAVYQVSADAGIPTIAKAKADSVSTSIVIGVATADIAIGAVGIITTQGLVRGINTVGLATTDTLFLSATTAGEWSNTLPDSPSFAVALGKPIVIGADGAILVNIIQSQTLAGSIQSKVFTLPLRAVVGGDPNITGELRTVATGETTDYATDFAVGNNHIYLRVATLIGSGDITITGASLSESTAVPVIGDTETITVDAAGADVYYQSAKKWWEVTNIDIPAGITSITYDIGVVGYSDVGNTDFKITGYRLDSTSQGVSSEVRFRLIKIQDDGGKRMSIVDLEDMTIDSGVVGSQIIDNVRTGGDDRSFDPDVADIWPDGSQVVLKMGDFDTYFSSDENIFNSSSEDEGFILRIEQANNVDFVTIRLDYQVVS